MTGPNPNMGTAHGRIRITVDDKQAQLLAQHFESLGKTMQKMQTSMSKMQTSMSRMERSLNSVEVEMRKARQEAAALDSVLDDLGGSVGGVSHRTNTWSRDLVVLRQQIHAARAAAERFIPPLQKLSELGNIFNAYRTNNNGFFGMAKGMAAAGKAAGGLGLLRTQLLGVDRAMRDLPRWQQNIINTVGRLQLLSFVGAGAFATLNRVVRTFSLGKIRLDAITTAKAVEVLGRRSEGLGFAFDHLVGKGRKLGRALVAIPNGLAQAVTGFAIMRSGLKGLSDRFTFLTRSISFWSKMFPGITAAIATAISAMPALLEVAAKSLTGISNLLLGTLDAAKQLAGGFLVLPGIFAVIGAGVSTLAATFMGLKDQFKDLFDADPTKQMEALLKLPEHLRPLGQMIVDTIPKIKEFQKALQIRALDGFIDQIKPIVDRYLPLLQSSMLQVVTSFRNAKDQIVGFVSEAKTISAIDAIYSRTAQIINGLAPAIRPAAGAMRDIAVIGATWLRDMTPMVTILIQKFAEWGRVNAENGNVMRWIQDSFRGLVDLKNATLDVVDATWSLLTMFSSNTGENGLERLAKGAERLNNAIQKSLNSGFLRDFSESVKGAGTESIQRLMDIIRSLAEPVKQLIPLIQDVSSAFADKMVPSIKAAAQILEVVFDLLNETGLGKIIGSVLGSVAAFKLLTNVLGPLKNIFKVVFGGLTGAGGLIKAAKGIETVSASLGGFVGKFGNAGAAMGTVITQVGGAASKLIGILSGLGAAIAIVTTAWIAYRGRSEMINSVNKGIADSSEHARQGIQDLKDAFIEDKGLVGGTVLDSLRRNMETNLQDLDNLAAQAPDIMDHIGDLFTPGEGAFNFKAAFLGESDAFNAAQATSEAAERITKAFDQVDIGGEELKKGISGTFETFNELKKRLTDIGATEAADKLQEWRNEFEQLRTDMERLGPGGAQIAEGIQKIANAGGEATTKLEGLKTVLQGLGILKTDTLDAAFAYQEGLRDLTKSVEELSTRGINFSDALTADGKSFNTASEGAQELYNILKPLGDQFLAQVANGANAQEEYKKFEEQLGHLATSTGLPIEALRNLAAQVGLVPDTVGILVQLDGKDQIVQDLTTVVVTLQNSANRGVAIPIHVSDPKAIDDQLQQIIGRDVADVEGSNLIIKPGVSDADLQKVQAILAQKGIATPGGPTPVPATLPVQPSTAETGKIGTDPLTREPERAAASGVSTAKDKVNSDLDKMLEEIQGKFGEASNEANSAGKTFVDQYAAGIRNNPAAVNEANRMAEEILKRFHRSPPKKGPLAEHGDAALYAGQQFGSIYASGIASSTGTVAGAASSVAGAASGGLKGDKFYETGKFLGQLSQLSDFAQHFVDAMTKMTTTVLQFGKFLSDPEGKGTFFGKQRGFVRDKSISDAQLAANRADQAQQNIFSFFGSKQYPTSNIDWQTGMPKITAPGQLTRQSSKSDIQAAVAAAGQAAGASKEDIAAAFAIIDQETGGTYSPTIVGKGMGGGGADAIGLFQQTLGMWGTMEELTNPNVAIQKYWDEWKKTPAGSAAGRAVGVQRPGGYGTKEIEKRMADGTLREIDSILGSGAVLPTVTGQIAGLPAITGLTRPSNVTGGQNQPQVDAAAALIDMLFPAIQKSTIGGQRQDRLPYHTEGRALDVMIPDPNTPQGKALGDAIKNWALQNASAIGLEDVIWQDFWQPVTGTGNKMGAGPPGSTAGHYDHVHLTFKDGGVLDLGPGGANIKAPIGSSAILPQGMDFGPPPRPDYEAPTKPELVVRNPDGTFSPVHGAEAGQLPGDIKINPATGRPWTPEETAAFWNLPENAPQFDQALLQGTQLGQPGMFQGTQEQLLEETKAQTPLLRDALDFAEKGLATGTEADAIRFADALATEVARQEAINTPESRARASVLSSAQSQISSAFGLKQAENPFDTATQVIGSFSSVAGDIFKVVNSTIEAIGATKDITETLIRYPENTEDIFRMIDDFQKYIQLGADVAGAVSSIASAIGSVVPDEGTFGAGAAVSAVGQIAGLIQSALETANAMIDLGQEAYRIIGSYVGDFLGYLVGGAGGPIRGNVKFLLDQKTNQLLAYGQDNPLDKRAHTLPFSGPANPNLRNQVVGQLNYYAGPGTDPRDDTRQMMYQVKTSQLAGMGATGQ